MTNLERHLLYGKTVELCFNPTKHHYTIGSHTTDPIASRLIDETVDGCTSVLGVISKPALLGWAVNQCAGYIDKNLPTGRVIDEVEKMELLTGAKKAHRQFSQKAADIGTLAHKFIEEYVTAKIEGKAIPALPSNEMLLDIVNNFFEWEDKKGVEFKSCERKIYSREYNVAGTLDLTAVINGKNVLLDIKTSTGIWDEYWLQTSFYKAALQEEFPETKISHCGIIRLGKDGSFEVKELNDFDKNIKAFAGALALYRRLKEMKHLEYINS